MLERMFDQEGAERWRRGLNEAQLEAVLHDGRPLLVVAGAGTGKTRTLVARLARLLEQGAAPERTLLLTFSRRASKEMLGRAQRLAGGPEGARVWGGTFHAMANRLLRRYGGALGLPPSFTIMDSSDSADLMDLVRSELGLGATRRRFPRKQTLQQIYSATVNSQTKLTEVVEKRFPWCREEISEVRSVFEAYSDRKRARIVLDYDDLLLFWRALTRHLGASRQLHGLFDHILVDEYQDTNELQAAIVAGMRGAGTGVMAVGDDAQAIYSFRAASAANMLSFCDLFPGARVVLLEQNYRSTQPILDVSNEVIAQAKDGYSKRLWSERPGTKAAQLLQCEDESAQSDEVCSRVLEARERGVLLREQAVLFRTGHHSAGLELELSRRNIPFVKYGGLKFLEAAHVKDVLGLLRFIENPDDELSWFRSLQLIEGVGPHTARSVMEELGVGDGGAVRRAAEGLSRPPQADSEEWARFSSMISDLCGSDGAPAPQLDRIMSFYSDALERIYPNAAVRVRDIEALAHMSVAYSSRADFLAEITLDPPASTEDLAGPPLLDDDYLILSTIHSAKGCEWDEVHVLDVCDGMIPSDMALSEDEGLEEERRVFYVALTRARNGLYLHRPIRYYHRRMGLDDGHGYGQLSRFVTDAVKARLEVCAEQAPEGGAVSLGLKPDRSEVDDFLASLWS